jgi:hypothetical protein
MFTKLGQFFLFGVGRAQPARPTTGHPIDGRPNDHFVATAHRPRRPTLVCRWRQVPSTGVLECNWRSVEVPMAGKPRPMRLIVSTASPADAVAASEPPLLRPAA